MLRRLLRILLLVLVLVLAACTRPPSAKRTVAGVDNLAGPAVPGTGAGLFRDERFEELAVSGARKAGVETPLARDDRFHLGSCTKAMTATLAGLLVEAGTLDWSTPLGDLLPNLAGTPYAALRFDTLLVHRAGLPATHPVLRELAELAPRDGRRRISEVVLALPPATPPGETFRYSNLSYIVAAHALETASRKPWEELVREELFEPLGMSSCGVGPTSREDERTPSGPWGHARANGTWVPRHFDNPLAMAPSSSVHCSLEDWGKFLKLHLDGFNEAPRLLTAETFRKLHQTHPAGDSSYTYGGWNLLSRRWASGPVLAHTGSNTLNYANVWIAPRRNAFVLATANAGGDAGFRATDDLLQRLIRRHLPE
jgi:CubicO group peptidase (beta-lactamase class C family)